MSYTVPTYTYSCVRVPTRVNFSRIGHGRNMSKLYLTFDVHNAQSHINPPTTTVVRDILRRKNAVESVTSAVIKRLKGTIISGGFAHRILHIMHCITMSLRVVYPHFCSIIFGFGVYPVCNLLL